MWTIRLAFKFDTWYGLWDQIRTKICKSLPLYIYFGNTNFVFVFAVWPKIQYPIAFLGVWSQICTISIDSKHWVFFSDTFHEVWHIYFWNLVRFWFWYWNSCRFKSCEFADKNFNIRTINADIRLSEEAKCLRNVQIMLVNFYNRIWGLQFLGDGLYMTKYGYLTSENILIIMISIFKLALYWIWFICFIFWFIIDNSKNRRLTFW